MYQTDRTVQGRVKIALSALAILIFCGASGPALYASGSVGAGGRDLPEALTPILAQTDQGAAEETVKPKDVERYIAVYKSMQHNHSLTVKDAAAKQGLTVDQFRDIESRIERNDRLRQRVRQALKPGGRQRSGAVQ